MSVKSTVDLQHDEADRVGIRRVGGHDGRERAVRRLVVFDDGLDAVDVTATGQPARERISGRALAAVTAVAQFSGRVPSVRIAASADPVVPRRPVLPFESRRRDRTAEQFATSAPAQARPGRAASVTRRGRAVDVGTRRIHCVKGDGGEDSKKRDEIRMYTDGVEHECKLRKSREKLFLRHYC